MFLLPQEGPQGEIGPAGPTQQVQKQEIHSLTIIPGLLNTVVSVQSILLATYLNGSNTSTSSFNEPRVHDVRIVTNI